MDINREISDYRWREYCRARDESVAAGRGSFAYRTWELEHEDAKA